MGFLDYMHEHKIELSITAMASGGIGTVLTAGGIMANEEESGIFGAIKDSLGNWIYWAIILSVVFMLLGIFYYLDFYFKRKEFLELFQEKSKSKFIKNQDRIEELAWRLHPRYEEMVMERKKQFKIR